MILNRVIELRKRKKWSLQYTADQLGIAKSTYAGYESGYRRPSLEAIKLMADLFETSVDYLLGRVDTETFHPEKENIQELELTQLSEIKLTVDGKPLSDGEINQLIAFIRSKREIEGLQTPDAQTQKNW
ncbi:MULTISPECIES: helix-turn-helix domain-containing protein [Thermoactinomyces]|jgi:transcriptional regulator with XRE-family HTH domain|uniref:Helix-turn-helix transcriptional regulator n=1 Tax=Thermoactinomyces daqus TaxID=1329516 RepID=A0A7W2AH21_9BACL|nr:MULTISPECIES: helix-turn-helix transcriptional regulator [Thermoactinomyces]MBA4541725.1 helix-turn-helix transcriptional regulator [Thermoactinomyces daqus]MBH8597190.1 helix-turn-helix transcriptional regulator [Thermoactinomyces sp. CICC 10523]MBH8602750.1 helix-turn-helix transcriptional regulator [Thermoactinomyces sp. CICC 10522]MBH8606141.1 helix-turn-helix transcriptional regulator [Thermoactinomyces sp. CICC 10521]